MHNTWELLYKLPLGMQRPIVNNELSKERCGTCKGRKSMMLCGYTCIHKMQLVNCISTYTYSYIAVLFQYTKLKQNYKLFVMLKFQMVNEKYCIIQQLQGECCLRLLLMLCLTTHTDGPCGIFIIRCLSTLASCKSIISCNPVNMLIHSHVIF